jgi:hypothetical protein
MNSMPKRTCLSLAFGIITILVLPFAQPALAQFGGMPQQIAAQLALEKHYSRMHITDQFLGLSIPGNTLGQTVGVAVNSRGDLFVYSRSDPQGIARGGQAARLFEWGPVPGIGS